MCWSNTKTLDLRPTDRQFEARLLAMAPASLRHLLINSTLARIPPPLPSPAPPPYVPDVRFQGDRGLKVQKSIGELFCRAK